MTAPGPSPAAPDVAGHPPQQVQYFLGRAADVPRVRRRWPGGGSPTVAPEASGGTWDTDFQRFHQVTWRRRLRAGCWRRPATGTSGRSMDVKTETLISSPSRNRAAHPGIDLSIGRLAPEPH